MKSHDFLAPLGTMGFTRVGPRRFRGRLDGLLIDVQRTYGLLAGYDASFEIALSHDLAGSEDWDVAFGTWLRQRLPEERGLVLRSATGWVAVQVGRLRRRSADELLAVLDPVLERIRSANAQPRSVSIWLARDELLSTGDRRIALERVPKPALIELDAVLDQSPALALVLARRIGSTKRTESAALRIVRDDTVDLSDRIDAVELLGAWGSLTVFELGRAKTALPLRLAVRRAQRRVRRGRGSDGRLSITQPDTRGALTLRSDHEGALSIDGGDDEGKVDARSARSKWREESNVEEDH